MNEFRFFKLSTLQECQQMTQQIDSRFDLYFDLMRDDIGIKLRDVEIKKNHINAKKLEGKFIVQGRWVKLVQVKLPQKLKIPYVNNQLNEAYMNDVKKIIAETISTHQPKLAEIVQGNFLQNHQNWKPVLLQKWQDKMYAYEICVCRWQQQFWISYCIEQKTQELIRQILHQIVDKHEIDKEILKENFQNNNKLVIASYPQFIKLLQ